MAVSLSETTLDPVESDRPITAITCSCGAWWTGISRAHCGACHLTFSTDGAADRHRVGRFGVDRRCADPAEAGLVVREKPYGALWGQPAPDAATAERRAASWA